jgi:NitT/TauT family transport system substrate-binding protein
MMQQRRSLRIAALALVTAGAVARPAAAQAPVPVPTVVIGVSVSIWPAIVAREKGFFRAQGLDIDFIDSGASARSVQQVAAGSAMIGSSSMVDTVRAIAAGAGVKVFVNSLAVGTHSLIAGKGIKSVADLKGKRVMTGGAGDITNLWWQAVARHFGLDPEKDVELLFSGATTARMAALYAGAIEASVLSTPQSFKAIEDGFTDLGPVAPYLGEFPMMIWNVNARWAQGNEKLVLAFIRAHNQAVLYLTDPAHREERRCWQSPHARASTMRSRRGTCACRSTPSCRTGRSRRKRSCACATRSLQAATSSRRRCRRVPITTTATSRRWRRTRGDW